MSGKNKKTMILIGVVIAIIAIVGIFTFLDLGEEAKIRGDINKVKELMLEPSPDYDKLNELLTRRLTKRKYLKVEDAAKKYYIDLLDNSKNVSYLTATENIDSYLTESNLTTDAPLFTKSQTNITNTKAQLEEFMNNLDKLSTNNSTILAYILKNTTESYYVNFYKELTIDNKDETYYESYKSSHKKAIEKLTIYEETLKFLKDNSEHWRIKESVLTFDNNELKDKYLDLVKKANSINAEAEIITNEEVTE